MVAYKNIQNLLKELESIEVFKQEDVEGLLAKHDFETINDRATGTKTTALITASQISNFETVVRLVSLFNADITLKDYKGKTAEDWAKFYDNNHSYRYLVKLV